MLDPELEGRMKTYTDGTTSIDLCDYANVVSREELERQLKELRVEIATLKYALRHIYTRVEAARDAFSGEVLELIRYRKEERK